MMLYRCSLIFDTGMTRSCMFMKHNSNATPHIPHLQAAVVPDKNIPASVLETEDRPYNSRGGDGFTTQTV